MAVASAVRYTGSAVDLILAIAFLGIAAIHAVTGVATAILPAVGGVVLLGAAIALAPVTRRRLRENVTSRDDVIVFLGAFAIATISLGVFVALGRWF